jgi:CheY-like chemotaxis protein
VRRTLGETVALRTDFDVTLKPALVDAHQFENALINLALNARDAMPAGGNLHIEATNVRLDDEHCEFLVDAVPGDYVKVVVSDDGTGMPPEVLERAFDPFFTTKPSGKGSGLGLSMVYGFVKQSRGDMTIESEVGVGTVITLYLPIAETETVADMAPAAEVVMPRGAERVLVVEDDDGLRAVSARMFRSQGYKVTEAKTGADALEALSAEPAFDLLFTDVVLPGGMDGKAVAAEAIAQDPALKVLFTTGYAEMVIGPEDGFPEGTVHLISKPFGREDLLTRVRQILDGDGDGEGDGRSPASLKPPMRHGAAAEAVGGRRG